MAVEDIRRTLSSIDADVRSSLAMSRATLHALACLGANFKAAAESALDEEVCRAASRLDQPASRRVLDTLQDMRDQLGGALDDTAVLNDIERLLLEAAAVLPDEEEEPTLFRAVG